LLLLEFAICFRQQIRAYEIYLMVRTSDWQKDKNKKSQFHYGQPLSLNINYKFARKSYFMRMSFTTGRTLCTSYVGMQITAEPHDCAPWLDSAVVNL